MRIRSGRLRAVAWSALALFATNVHSHGNENAKDPGSVHREQKAWGVAADPALAQRTLRISMNDRMRFEPDSLVLKQGETVRLLVTNDGKLKHELVIGTRPVLEEHAALMKKFPNMEHDEPYMVHVAPGKTGEIIWTFNRAGEFHFACLIAGHYEAGMTGRIRVEARDAPASVRRSG
jgi:uncharacterized cupredoxin-like copper-binding protein